MSEPTPPIAIEGDGTLHELAPQVDASALTLPAGVEVDATPEHGRDWWPLAMKWALDGEVPGLPSRVARPTTTDEVVAVARACNDARVPLTAAGGRSGVCGASVPVHGGVVLDTTAMTGIV